jgi:3-phenylpropionate/trans-cinnamate dioxygenase ferredoxin component
LNEADYVPVARADDVAADRPHRVLAAGQDILLCRDGADIFAIENRCSHAESALECGRIRFGWISCPAHGARFDLETGEALTAPATAPIRTYRLRIVDGEVQVAL